MTKTGSEKLPRKVPEAQPRCCKREKQPFDTHRKHFSQRTKDVATKINVSTTSTIVVEVLDSPLGAMARQVVASGAKLSVATCNGAADVAVERHFPETGSDSIHLHIPPAVDENWLHCHAAKAW